MNKYELAVVLSPGLEDSDRKKSLTILEQVVEKFCGKATDKLVWGKKDLVHPIGKHVQGWYEIWQVNLPGEAVADLTKSIKINEGIIRFLITKQIGPVAAKAVKVKKVKKIIKKKAKE